MGKHCLFNKEEVAECSYADIRAGASLVARVKHHTYEKSHPYASPIWTGCVASNLSWEECSAIKDGMQDTDKDLGIKKVQYRIRARGKRNSKEVIEFYITKVYNWYVKRNYQSKLEPLEVMFTQPQWIRAAKMRAMQDLPLQFGKTFSLYRNYRYD